SVATEISVASDLVLSVLVPASGSCLIQQIGPNRSVYGKLRAYKCRRRDFEPSAALADRNKAMPGLLPGAGMNPLCVGTSVPALSA
ncbi:hypothetical protein, partial [Pseudomonas prosekii]